MRPDWQARASTHCHAFSPVQPSVAAEPRVARRGAARQWQSKAYVGVGLSLVLAADGAPAVAFAWPGGPAHGAGVSVGDRVVSRCGMGQLYGRHLCVEKEQMRSHPYSSR